MLLRSPKIIDTPCRMSLMYNAVAEGREIQIPMDTDIPYVVGVEADPNAGKTAWFDFSRCGILGFDAVRKTPERDGDRDNELWVRRVPILGKPNSMLFLNMLSDGFRHEKDSIDNALLQRVLKTNDINGFIPFTRQNFADIVFISNCDPVGLDLEIDMTVTDESWGRSSKLLYNSYC
jgi:hypothetical protein